MLKCPECNAIKPELWQETVELTRFDYTLTNNTIQRGDDLEGCGMPSIKAPELHCRACHHKWPIPKHLKISI